MDLAVCTDIVTLHGGTIGCVSVPRKGKPGEGGQEGGSEFFFNIKFEVSQEGDDDDFR